MNNWFAGLAAGLPEQLGPVYLAIRPREDAVDDVSQSRLVLLLELWFIMAKLPGTQQAGGHASQMKALRLCDSCRGLGQAGA